MSSGITCMVVKNATVALVITALLSLVAQAANPSAHSLPSTPVKEAKAPTAPLPPDKPGPRPTRGPASLTRQTPFSEAIDILRNSTTPPLKIIVLWRPLGDSAGVYRDTPIGIDGVAGLRAGQVLDLLTLSLSAGASAKIGYVVDKGIITISTTDALPTPKPVVRLYDVSDLVAPPARYSLQSMGFGMGYGMGYGGQMTPFGGYPGSPGAGSSSPTGGTYGNAGQITRVYPSR